MTHRPLQPLAIAIGMGLFTSAAAAPASVFDGQRGQRLQRLRQRQVGRRASDTQRPYPLGFV